MSVGVQRLRDEPDVIRQGAIDKGEDPSVVDRALELDGRRRRLLGESEALKAEHAGRGFRALKAEHVGRGFRALKAECSGQGSQGRKSRLERLDCGLSPRSKEPPLAFHCITVVEHQHEGTR